MTLISVPDHAAARVICRVLKLRRLPGSWKSPAFADSHPFPTAQTVLFVNTPSPRGRRGGAQRSTTDIQWAYMLGRGASVSPRPLIALYLGLAQDGNRTPTASRSVSSGVTAAAAAGSLWLVNRVEDRRAGHSYFPDILVNPGLRETGVIGSADGLEAARTEGTGAARASAIPDGAAPLLIDPHAAAFCRTAFAFLPPNQIACCELLASTAAEETAPTEQQVESLARLAAELALIAAAGMRRAC